MLTYLLPYQTRRRLLCALFLSARTGTLSALARAAGISPAAAHKELHALERLGLVERQLQGAQHHFQATPDHPHAPVLRALLALPLTPELPPPALPQTLLHQRDRIKSDLAALGAPLKGHRIAVHPSTTLENALAQAIALAPHDLDIARVLPALLARHAPRLDDQALTAALFDLRHKHTGGFFLALASELAQDPTLNTRAELLRDRRRKRTLHFFTPQATPKLAADNHTLPLALAWGFHYPLPLASFIGLEELSGG